MLNYADDLENRNETLNIRIPMVDIYETVEGEGTHAGYPTVFVRLFGCNLRCSWCDTKYSYPPYEADNVMTIGEIIEQVTDYKAKRLCLTGGEPLLYGERSQSLIEALVATERYADIHVETNGAVNLAPFLEAIRSPIVRYIMDYKLPDSGENERMIDDNLLLLRKQDELKFVIATDEDFAAARRIVSEWDIRATVLFSPVWETMPPARLAELILSHGLTDVRLNLQMHKVIWDPGMRRV